MVDKYTKVVLTIIAVGLWVQIGIQTNLVGSASAEFDYNDSEKLQDIVDQLDTTNGRLTEISNHVYRIYKWISEN
jgi:hypothetical protein